MIRIRRAARLAESGRSYVETRDGLAARRIKTAEAIDAFGAIDEGRSGEAALAQPAYSLPLVRRQRRTIAAMQVSCFWRARNAWFALKRRLRIGPLDDPIPEASAAGAAAELAAFGDPYFLFREQHRLRAVDVDRMRAMTSVLPVKPCFGLVIETSETGTDGLRATIDSLRAQIYDGWHARVIVDDDHRGVVNEHLAEDLEDPRIVVGPYTSDAEDFLGALRPGDRLEPNALFEVALAVNRPPAVDALYTDEMLDERGARVRRTSSPIGRPKPTLRGTTSGDCACRRTALEAVGGLHPVFSTAAGARRSCGLGGDGSCPSTSRRCSTIAGPTDACVRSTSLALEG